ncbi:uncharacterized protein LOC124285231 isoform X2 [Haliotis rubra]|uniref:uncharacterized protein LOC124285231 isoform X2 n=1 Tax=Haliotis rubra TaxID=36100 RepID=UPI001EE5D70E|nr:uncharacterized protein LOC124285231 isoform X2 [Haliotis rubra]
MIVTAAVLLSVATLAVAVNPQKVGSFPVKNAAFTNIYRTVDRKTNKTSYDLLITSFDGVPFSTDYAYIVRDVGRYMDNVGGITPQTLTDKVTWPNEISGVPQNVFNSSMVAIPDGFLVPFKTKGGIKLVNISGSAVGAPVRITEESGEDWFYHRVQWVDMDNDGDYDALTCRARKPLFGSEEGELLWYENPSTPTVRPGWTPHVIAKGPDVYFQYYRLKTPNGTRSCIFTAQFFTKSLSVYWTESGNWMNSGDVKSKVIDNTIGAVFDVTVNDIGNDGYLDLLVTTNDATNGSVLAYEIPPDFRTGTFPRHLLASGFKPRSEGMGKGAPGSAYPIKYIVPPYKRPFIVSGDDDGRAYVLLCTSYDWTYNLSPFLDVGQGTVGQITVEDVNEDYKLDIFVPAYDQGVVHVYQYNP